MTVNESDYPIRAETPGVTGRDGYLIAEALYLAAKWIPHQAAGELKSDRKDMLRILEHAFPDMLDMFRAEDR
jgi:hypothetical protein